jgi:hypothetical protein
MEAEAGKVIYACRMNIMARTKTDSQKGEYGASLAVLFCASRQMTAVVQTVAVEKGLPWRTVPEVTVMLGDGRRETSTKLFFIEIKAYRSTQSTREPETILIAAYGVKDLAPAAAAAPELPLLRHRFPGSRPALSMESWLRRRSLLTWSLHGTTGGIGQCQFPPAASTPTSFFY